MLPLSGKLCGSFDSARSFFPIFWVALSVLLLGAFLSMKVNLEC